MNIYRYKSIHIQLHGNAHSCQREQYERWWMRRKYAKQCNQNETNTEHNLQAIWNVHIVACLYADVSECGGADVLVVADSWLL